jgi:hypothetical protein
MKKKQPSRRQKLEALRRESERVLTDRLRQRLVLPPERLTNFLRKKVGLQGNCL